LDGSLRAAAKIVTVEISGVDVPATSEGDEITVSDSEEKGSDNEELEFHKADEIRLGK